MIVDVLDRRIQDVLKELEEKIHEIADMISKLSEAFLFVETPKYPFVRELGNKNYRSFFLKKKIHRARSCC